jgi:hypothetical protein
MYYSYRLQRKGLCEVLNLDLGQSSMPSRNITATEK